MTKVYVGQTLIAFVPKAINGGQDHAPATVTAVDRTTGRPNLNVQLDVGTIIRQLDVTVVDNRAAGLDELDRHWHLLPGHRTEEGRNGELVHVSGRNTLTGEDWSRTDVCHWEPVAYLVDTTPIEPAAAARPVAPLDAAVPAPATETRDERRARLLAELADTDAE